MSSTRTRRGARHAPALVCHHARAMGSLVVLRMAPAPAEVLAARSCAWNEIEGRDAELVAAAPSSGAVVLGAFQRATELGTMPATSTELPVVRRGSGGAAARVGPGCVWVQLALVRPDALVSCTADKLLNRYVRPLRRALTRVTGHPANYFGRDWISAAHRPVALVGFAHDASSGRCLFEAILAVSAPFALSARPSFLGKEPATLEEIAGRSIEDAMVMEAVASSYRELASESREVAPPALASMHRAVATLEPAWLAMRQEAIGTVASGPDAEGRLRVGGELMVSRDALARLEELVAALPVDASPEDVGRVVDDALTPRGAVTFGVRSLASVRDVIVEARLKTSPATRSRT